MTLKTVDMPFNKDLCTVSQLKEAAETLELIFGMIETAELDFSLSNEDLHRKIGRSVLQYHEHWKVKYFPKPEPRPARNKKKS